MPKRVVKFRAVKTVKKPVTVKFRTKDGDTVSFKAIRTTKEPANVKFHAGKNKKK
ncbi:hypothetical protein HQ544_05355 [Candidatus Falkowbacteria bacterium]|nr:hypothetical protein [Candidatus Falkowbacteria bacterium]